MSNSRKNIIISLATIGVIAVFFTIGTLVYSPEKEFEKLKNENVAKTGENLVLSVWKVSPQEVAKTIDIIGEIDQQAVVISANFASTVSFVEKEGKKLKKKQKVVEFINGVVTPIPFDGVVSEVFVDLGQNVSVGEKLFVVLPSNVNKTKMKIQLPIAYTTVVKKGMSVKVLHNEKEFAGEITNISVYSGSESGAVKTVVEMEKNEIPHNAMLESLVEISRHSAYFVPKTAVFLSENSAAVKIIDEQKNTQTMPVEIVKESDDGFFVACEKMQGEVQIVSVNPAYAEDGKSYEFSVVNVGLK